MDLVINEFWQIEKETSLIYCGFYLKSSIKVKCLVQAFASVWVINCHF